MWPSINWKKCFEICRVSVIHIKRSLIIYFTQLQLLETNFTIYLQKIIYNLFTENYIQFYDFQKFFIPWLILFTICITTYNRTYQSQCLGILVETYIGCYSTNIDCCKSNIQFCSRIRAFIFVVVAILNQASLLVVYMVSIVTIYDWSIEGYHY